MLYRFIPARTWLANYQRSLLEQDLLAALIVTIMLIPQSLAYALLAGVPAEVGLYASILPLIAYAIFGTSHTLAVGPVAVVSLMTAATIGQLPGLDESQRQGAAIALALLCGVISIAMGALRLGKLANLLSHPVISGFITASGVIIAASQLKHLLGIELSGHNLVEIVLSLAANWQSSSVVTLLLGTAALALLVWVRGSLKPLLIKLGLSVSAAGHLAKTGPVAAVVATTAAVWGFSLEGEVAIVGSVPQQLPSLALPSLDLGLWQSLLVPAMLICLVGFVESVSIAQTLAAKRRQQIVPNQELVGLGAANIASAVSGGIPVTGGFSRSVVNFDAGAQTPAAGVFTAVGIALATLLLTPAIYYLPKATLAATIIVAVLSLIDLKALARTWHYSKGDFSAMLATILCTLAAGVEAGISAGVILSIALHLNRTSEPHSAICGQVPGTEHFRNVERHQVNTDPSISVLRIDESLYFVNARFLEQRVYQLVADNPSIEHLVLMCPAVNGIDASALESLEAINARLKDSGVTLHLSEVKGAGDGQARRQPLS